jgi:hypothetical protein
MKSDPASSAGNYYMFYNAPALLDHNSNKEFGTVIAEAKNRLIIVDDIINRNHVYLIPKTEVDHYHSNDQIYFNIAENNLKNFEM